MPADPRPTVLVTGASGVLGSALLRELGDAQVVGLVHRGTLAVEHAEPLRADVTATALGLGAHAYRELVARTDVVVHAAGLTDFAAPAHRHHATNIVGTERILELASAAGAIVHHVSTAWVQAIRDDAPRPLCRENVIYDYVASKVTAERLVAASGVPHSIYRPSNLIGDSRTGEVRASQLVPQLARELLRGRLPLLPARRGARLDMVPDDVCGRTLAAAVLAGEHGATHWLTYGPASPTIAELAELCGEVARASGRSFTPPVVVDPDSHEQIEAALAQLPRRQRALFPWLVELSDGMTSGGLFPSSLQALGDRYGMPVPDLRASLRHGLAHMAGKRLAPV